MGVLFQLYRDYSAMSCKAMKGQPFKSSVKVTQTTGAAQGTLVHIEYQYAQHVNAPPTNNTCVGNIDLLGNLAVEDVDVQSEVTAASEADVGQNADQSVATQEGPQVPAQFNAQWNVGLCNRDSNFQVGNLDQAVVAQGAKDASNQGAADILDQQSKLGAASVNSQINMVVLGQVQEGNTAMVKLGGELGALRSEVERIRGDVVVEVGRVDRLEENEEDCGGNEDANKHQTNATVSRYSIVLLGVHTVLRGCNAVTL